MNRPAADLYDTDFAEWSARNADLLRQGRLDEADLEHIAEEIEDLGKNWHGALDSRIYQLIIHLLKCQFQPVYPGRNGWRRTIAAQRIEIGKLLRKAPSLQNMIRENLAENYADAVELAALETGLPASTFPAVCPYTQEQLLDKSFLP